MQPVRDHIVQGFCDWTTSRPAGSAYDPTKFEQYDEMTEAEKKAAVLELERRVKANALKTSWQLAKLKRKLATYSSRVAGLEKQLRRSRK